MLTELTVRLDVVERSLGALEIRIGGSEAGFDRLSLEVQAIHDAHAAQQMSWEAAVADAVAAGATSVAPTAPAACETDFAGDPEGEAETERPIFATVRAGAVAAGATTGCLGAPPTIVSPAGRPEKQASRSRMTEPKDIIDVWGGRWRDA